MQSKSEKIRSIWKKTDEKNATNNVLCVNVFSTYNYQQKFQLAI